MHSESTIKRQFVCGGRLVAAIASVLVFMRCILVHAQDKNPRPTALRAAQASPGSKTVPAPGTPPTQISAVGTERPASVTNIEQVATARYQCRGFLRCRGQGNRGRVSDSDRWCAFAPGIPRMIEEPTTHNTCRGYPVLFQPQTSRGPAILATTSAPGPSLPRRGQVQRCGEDRGYP
jgi:hypothetical protein